MVFPKTEGFDSNTNFTDMNLSDDHNYSTKFNDESYDKFYSFLYNDIYYDTYTIDNVVKKIAKIIIDYSNSVYNHHLDVSSKCGHLTEFLKNSLDTKCMQRHQNLLHYEHFKYPGHNIINGSVDDSNAIRANTFSHISLINYDIYDYEYLGIIMKNMSHWLIDRGYLFVQVFDNFSDIESFYNQNGDLLNGKLVYSSQLQKHLTKPYSLIEKLRMGNKERKNIHTKYFHHNNNISYYANMYGLMLVDKKKIVNGTSLMIFRKTQD